MARVYLIGSKGWIGQQVLDLLCKRSDVALVQESTVRADDLVSLQEKLRAVKPTHVISCMGRTHGVIDGKEIPTIDYLEYPGKLQENVRDNLFAPVALAKICTDMGIHFTYLGTGCIFEYDEAHFDAAHGFRESSLPNFFGSGYSVVKGFTDRMMALYENSVLNVRIRMPITAAPNPRDFITKIVNYEKICSMENSMTVLDDLLPIMVDMALTCKTGTINLSNPGTISHETILQIYKEVVDPSKTWQTMTYEEQSRLLKSKRSNNALDTSKLVVWYPYVKNIDDAVRSALTKRKAMMVAEMV